MKDFHLCNEKARSYFDALEYKPNQPLSSDIRKSLLLYNKWRTKSDIALNEYNASLIKFNPNKLPWTLKQLEQESITLKDKLAGIEGSLAK
ncbi:MAG: hypothetical protein WCI60_03170 [bacterium]